MQYLNGNALITLEEDGTRLIEYSNSLLLDYPLNIDIRVSTSCSFANNICKEFCHESAVTKGKDCDYTKLKEILKDLPEGIELAIGCNYFSVDLYEFLEWCKVKKFIANITINQGHIKRDLKLLEESISKDLIKGLGISYRSSLKWDIPESILNYKNTVFHVILGLDSFKDVENLDKLGVNKLLLLGEKNFGYNKNKVDLTSRKHKEWTWWIASLFNKFKIVSFDNLALEQLKLKRFFSEENWQIFNQEEHSFYIDAVQEIFKPNSRSEESVNWNIGIKSYFKPNE